jgi:hypothetical protein
MILSIGKLWYSGPTGPESRRQVVQGREERRGNPAEPRCGEEFTTGHRKTNCGCLSYRQTAYRSTVHHTRYLFLALFYYKER